MITGMRNRRLTAALNLSGSGLEYGPLHSAVVSKAHHNVRYADFADRAALVAHYKSDPAVDINLIPEIDIVTGGRLVSEFIDPNSLDYVVASHVWEHVPDFLGWLESNLAILRTGGRIAVAYPDKRYCFDLARRSTVLSDILAAYIEKRQKPTFTQLCDHFVNAVKTTPTQAWSGETTEVNAEPLHSMDQILPFLQMQYDANKYVDCHCWMFKDFELYEILIDLLRFVKTKYEIVTFFPTEKNSHEFYVTIEKR